MKIKFNYSKLRGLLAENGMSLTEYAKNVLNISYTSLNDRLQNRIYFNQNEIMKTATHFNLSQSEVNAIFFTV